MTTTRLSAFRRVTMTALAAVLAAIALAPAPAPASASTSARQTATVAGPTVIPQTGQTIAGLDVHDGMINKVGSAYYLYGTQYGTPTGCQFSWLDTASSFCGFGVWTSIDKLHWTYLGDLFDPNGYNSWRDESWQGTCVKHYGGGCFNPRMVQRAGDGIWILWFNAPDDYRRSGANAYYAMGCAGPAGPCGDNYTGGTTHKPNLYTCSGNGDFSIVNDGATAYIICTMPDQTLRIEPLDQWWTNGTGGGETDVGGLTNVESPAVFLAAGRLYLTYSDPNCGYCSGTGTSYLTSTTGMLGTWQRGGRVSATSCAGQPRSLSWVDGGVIEWIDQWSPSGAPNQTGAAVHLEPLHIGSSWQIQALSC
jgi:hypothetical protein